MYMFYGNILSVGMNVGMTAGLSLRLFIGQSVSLPLVKSVHLRKYFPFTSLTIAD